MLFKNYKQIIANGQNSDLQRKRKDALDILASAIKAVNPYAAVKNMFDDRHSIVLDTETIDTCSFDNIYLAGFGKASAGMAKAVCDSLSIKKGVIITNDPTVKKIDDNKVEVFVGGHPIPNKISIEGTERVIQLVDSCKENDLLIVLISGGGSALLCKPRVSLKDLQQTTNLLLKSGADINEINTIRKHISHVKGGQLIKSARCPIVSFIISDIIDDPIEFIASGPTSPDSTTFSDAKKVLKKYGLWNKIPYDVRWVIEQGIQRYIPETPKEDDPVFKNVFNYIVANNEAACRAAYQKAQKLGYNPMILTTRLMGEARNATMNLIERAKQHLYSKYDKTALISGGETTVTVKGHGLGGRNQELVLAAVEYIAGTDLLFISFATDGIDGNSDAAGAIADGFTLRRAQNIGLDPRKFLEDNNSYEFFSKLKDLLITGPTGTNVMDIQLILR
ncbi:MAG: glycerate kinase [Thermoplasmata archaeon]|nr:MAG: glycerate kinase [Thermoplasmata archaeon]RLF37019.1 MAG: glycerate kinase [Thermoplasmata archaeon]